MKALAMAAVLAGCGAQLTTASNNSQVDASSGSIDSSNGGGGGGGGGGMTDANVTNIDAPPACANGRQVYLAFEGVTLTNAATDATQNHAAWIGVGTAAVPPFHPNDANRMGEIQTIVDGVKSRLAGTPITVVTTRPASGPYVMVVLGGSNTIVGSNYTYATSDHDCGDLVKNDVGWVSDAPSLSYVPDLIVGTIGWGLGLQGTSDPADCMCAWANNCQSASGACTLSSSIATTISNGNTTCPNQNPQNEVAAFSTLFCQ
jgi:hypothetical protein